METTTIVPPDTGEMTKGIDRWVSFANTIRVFNATSYEEAGHFVRQIKLQRKTIVEKFAKPKGDAYRAHRSITALEKEVDAPAAKAEEIIAGKRNIWRQEEERKRRAEEERLREAARKEQEDAALAEAARLEAEGDKAAAAAVIDAPMPAPTVIVPKSIPKETGMSLRTTWKHRIVNAALIPREYLMPNEQAIRAFGRSAKQAAQIPGVEFYPVETEAFTRG